MDVLKEAASKAPDAPAVEEVPGEVAGAGAEPATEPTDGPTSVAEGVVRTYGEMDAWADQVARALVRSGLAAGDRVGMRLPPCAEAVVLIHAVSRAGGVLVPLNPGWTQAEIMRGLAAVGPPTLMFQTMGEVVEWGGADRASSEADEDLPGPAAGQPAAILLTSGSTGDPRPVALSHRNLQTSARGAMERLRLRPEDRWLASLSPAHVGGLALLHRAAVVGCSVLTRTRFDATETAELIDSGRVTHASLVPVMLARLLDARGEQRAPETLRCLLLGGAAVREPLLDQALALGYPVALTYGLTEASSQVATATPEEVRAKPGSVGKPLPGLEIRIDGEEPEESGEILVKGPTVVTGLAKASGSAGGGPASRGGGSSVHCDGEGWLHTGDLGRLDADGDLWVVGRLSERIVTGGVTVEPAEVEAALDGHPAVREVAVVGAPDPEWGERVVAVVIPEDASAPPSLEDLQAFSRERLASAKRPREVRIVEALPRNPNGKVRRGELRRRFG